MPDDKKKEPAKADFWNPRTDPDTIKNPGSVTFRRPRTFDFSDVAWNPKFRFWSQKEPMVEIDYSKKK